MFMIEKITAEETHSIRQSVLRPGRPMQECIFNGDDDVQTLHLGAFTEGKLVGIASFMVDTNDYFHGKQYRLRGMAVLPEFRGMGYGKKLVTHGENLLQQKECDILWFNAREIALKFYNGQGFNIKGAPFEISTVGTHHVMYKKLS
ncbi:MAG TPA: GNAT family N-acetyltransferase [Leeuwenhoekiella sp.]|nr:GNAT family N-acetyltransferase [Leeuwenhoekiella sp.]